MEIKLDNNKVTYVSPVCRAKFRREETMEVIVPDAQPDILDIIYAGGLPFLRGKEAVEGRVTISGVAEITILYTPENAPRTQKITVNLPFSAFEENKEITPDCLLVAKVTLISAEAKIMNPRKIFIKAELEYDAECYLQKDQSISYCKTSEENGVFFKNAEVSLQVPASVSEKTFVVTDELIIPVTQPRMEDLMLYSSKIEVEDTKSVGNKAITKGNVVTELLYTGESDQIHRTVFTSPFSQIIETDIPGEAEHNISIMLTGAYISRDVMEDSDGDALSLEIHAVAQCVTYLEQNIAYLSDAYSPKYELELERETRKFGYTSGITETEKTVAVQVDSQIEQRDVCFVHVAPAAMISDAAGIRMDVRVNLLYKNSEGDLECVSKKADVSMPFDADGVLEADISLEKGGDISVAMNGAVSDVKIPVKIRAKKAEKAVLEVINNISYNEQEEKNTSARPSVIIHRRSADDELWELAKKYNSSVKLINAVNPDAEDNSESDVMIIPKIR